MILRSAAAKLLLKQLAGTRYWNQVLIPQSHPAVDKLT
jgi:hypothetical protein